MSQKKGRAAAGEADAGILYLVATPIGNLDDLSPRAVSRLRQVGLIAAEDTRHSRPLLTHFGISTPLVSLHEHNERTAAPRLVERLLSGESVALIADAGTPLISDPGLLLVRAARDAGIRVVPVPGPCAAIAALSASGLPVDRFAFEGFPPRTSSQRRRLFETLRGDSRTLIFYESSHRVRETVADLRVSFEPQRLLVIARELTKLHETIMPVPLEDSDAVFDDPDMLKGEFVLMLEGASPETPSEILTEEQERILALLLEECSVKTASRLAAKITGETRARFYQRALALAGEADRPEAEG